LKGLFQEIEEAPLEEVHIKFEQILMCMTLIWNESNYYREPRRVIVLLREVVNTFIKLISDNIEPHALFGLEPIEAEPKVQAALKLIANMESALFETRVS
jgi:hypothetical protein